MNILKTVLILLLPSFVFALYLKKDGGTSNFFSRLIQKTQFFQMESQVSRMACGSGSDCVPEGLTNVSSALVNCQSGKCVCNNCFTRDLSTGKCHTCPDYKYLATTRSCGSDNRPEQLTAFLLSFFLSYVGAANFYIQQYTLAGGQLFLLVLSLIILCFTCCIPLYLACCISINDVPGSISFVVLTSVAVFLEVLVLIAIFAWWLADVIIFATNKRLSGNGCVLTHM